MFLGRRFLKRRSAVVSAPALSSNPRDPLLFLYPRLFSSSVTIDVRDNSQKAHTGSTEASPPANFLTSRESLDLDRLSSLLKWIDPQLRPRQPATQAPSRSRSLDRVGSDGLQDEGSGFGGQDGISEAWDRGVGGSQGTTRNARTRRTDEAAKTARKLVCNAERRERISAYNKRAREEYRRNKHGKKADPEADRAVVLRALQLHTPSHPQLVPGRKLKIATVPVSTVEQLIYSADNNLWNIKVRYDCEIELAEQQGNDPGFRDVIISGPVAGVAGATAEILQITPKEVQGTRSRYKIPAKLNTRAPRNQSPTLKEGHEKVKCRFVFPTLRGAMASPLNVDQVATPKVWTKESFKEYVQHLTSIKMSNHVHNFLYKKGQHHSHLVMEILRQLFTDPDYTTCITVEAANLALEYFVKCYQLRTVRYLYAHMEMISLRMNTETYNTILRGCARSKDIQSFRITVELMLSRGYLPNSRTWIAYLRTLESFHAKQRAISIMRSKGLLTDLGLMKSACSLLVGRELIDFLQSERGKGNFLEHMDTTYGKNWFGIESANQILHVLASRGLISGCLDFLDLMDRRQVSPDTISLNSILHHCSENLNWRGAIKALERLSNISSVVPDSLTYDALFKLAWRCRFYNMTRVLWQYACLDGASTFRMRERITRTVGDAVFDDTPADPHTALKFWNCTAGPFILGCTSLFPQWRPRPQAKNSRNQHIPLTEPKGERSAVVKIQPYRYWPPEGAAPEKRKLFEDAVRKIKEDMAAFKFLVPAEPLVTVVKAAISLDVKIWCDSNKAMQDLTTSQQSVSVIRRRKGLPGAVMKWVPGMRLGMPDEKEQGAQGTAPLTVAGWTPDELKYHYNRSNSIAPVTEVVGGDVRQERKQPDLRDSAEISAKERQAASIL
jgi:pentatricopeptide repeat protein